jgi:hypothetical protein
MHSAMLITRDAKRQFSTRMHTIHKINADLNKLGNDIPVHFAIQLLLDSRLVNANL